MMKQAPLMLCVVHRSTVICLTDGDYETAAWPWQPWKGVGCMLDDEWGSGSGGECDIRPAIVTWPVTL